MVNRVGFKVEGLTGVVAALLALGFDVEDLKRAFAAIAQEGAERAATFAPKRSGRLAGDIRGNRAKSKAVVTAGRASVPYAGVQNYGWPTRNIMPTHFMQKTDVVMQPRAIYLLEQEINQQIAKKGLR